ncbi:MAG: hypothetical protein HY324_03250 [Chlamydiia bacterium]|nr:hypothetical protein [Chlamydiia bacterium]
MGKLLFLFAGIPFFLFSEEEQEVFPTGDFVPWFTGSLLSFSPVVLPVGTIDIEPYLFSLAKTAVYDSDWKTQSVSTYWSNSSLTVFQVGVAPRVDIQVYPTFFWNDCQGTSHLELGDTSIFLDFQIFYADPGSWVPNIKLFLREIIPTGKYRNLSPHGHRTQIGGMGSWQTNLSLALGNVLYLGSGHFLEYRVFFNYDFPAPVHVKGFNYYGGGYGADARIFPGQNMTCVLSAEVNVTQNIAFAFDCVGEFASRDTYTGDVGALPNGEFAPLGFHSSTQLSLAPAIEYNWSNNMGIIGGAWFTIAGRNCDAFEGGVIAFNLLY